MLPFRLICSCYRANDALLTGETEFDSRGVLFVLLDIHDVARQCFGADRESTEG